MESTKLAGSIKVAILLQALGEARRQTIMNQLNEAERERLSGHLAQLGQVSPALVEKVAAEFIESLRHRSTRQIESPADASAPSGPEAQKGADPGTSAGLNSLLAMEPDHLAQLIKDEHPQTIAVILVHLKTETASEVLAKLPDEKKAEVAKRIANSDKIVSGMIEEIEKVFADILQNEDGAVTHKIGGPNRLADILNQADGSTTQMILDEIEDENPELAAQIKQMMFVFEDLVMVDDKGLQAMLRKVETRELAVALKAASEEVRAKIFRNMSERAGDMVREEIEALGSVRMRDVETAQQAITRLIQDMEEKGEVVIGGRGGEQFIA